MQKIPKLVKSAPMRINKGFGGIFITNTYVEHEKWATAPQSGFESLCGSGFARTGFRN